MNHHPSQMFTIGEYTVQSSGSCSAYISDMKECRAAAEWLLLADRDASDGQLSASNFPPGCYMKTNYGDLPNGHLFTGYLHLNSKITNNPTSCQKSRRCICPAGESFTLLWNFQEIQPGVGV